jgi:hypothetical protein
VKWRRYIVLEMKMIVLFRFRISPYKYLPKFDSMHPQGKRTFSNLL